MSTRLTVINIIKVTVAAIKKTVIMGGAALISLVAISCGGGGDTPAPTPTPNAFPSSNAGADQVVDENTLVNLAGAGSDADGTIASYVWSQTSGSDVTLQNAATTTATFTAPNIATEEVLVFRLTVTDDDGGSVSDTVEIQVMPNAAPAANAGTDAIVDEQTAVELTGVGEDTDGTIASYLWEQASGSSVSLTNANTATVSFDTPNITEVESLVMRLTVTDNDGDIAIDTVSIQVIPNIAPTANAGADAAEDERAIVALSGSGADSDGSIVSYLWTQTSGTVVSIENSDGESASFVGPSVDIEEDLTFQLSVTDNKGEVSSDSVTITMAPVFFEITLSEVLTNCGDPVAQDVDLFFYDAEGNEDTITVTHSGAEQTYLLDPVGIEDRRTVKFLNGGGDLVPAVDRVIVDTDRTVPIYFKMMTQVKESCDCPSYNISLTNELNASNSETHLWVGGRKTYSSNIDADGVHWSDIEVCDQQESTVYIVDNLIQKAAKVPFDTVGDITVSGLSDMATSILGGAIPEYSGAPFSPYARSIGYSVQGASNVIFSEFDLPNTDIIDDVLRYPDFEGITDFTQRALFPTSGVSLDITALPGFFSGTGSEYRVALEQHTRKMPASDLASGFSYDIFDIPNLSISMSANAISISPADNLPFDAALLLVLEGANTTEIWLPIENGVIDLSSVENAITGLSGALLVYFGDFIDGETYDEAIPIYYRRRVTGATVRSRSIRLSIF